MARDDDEEAKDPNDGDDGGRKRNPRAERAENRTVKKQKTESEELQYEVTGLKEELNAQLSEIDQLTNQKEKLKLHHVKCDNVSFKDLFNQLNNESNYQE